ncbi:IS3 family transposase [Serratia marcescens]
MHALLKREGWRDNHKRIYRLYREQGLSLLLNLPRRNTRGHFLRWAG